MSIRREEIQKLKSGNYIMVDDEPCEIKSTERSKSGKHGHAKVRVVCVGVFDENKRSLTFPSGDLVDVPIIEKGNAQINFIDDDKINILDLDTYQSIDVDWPDKEKLRNKLKELQGDPDKMSKAKLGFWRLAGNIIIKRVL
jgi:translation initiation factor 5A